MAEPSQPISEFIVQSDVFYQNIKSVYEPLDATRLQVRLMHILPAPYWHEQIEVTLSVVDLQRKPEYDALSYTWGSLTPTTTINLCGFSYRVTENQYLALRRFRLANESRTIWMDVACINQADVAERSRQVSIMSQIYASAALTRIWLGEPQPSWFEITDYDWNNHLDTLNSNSLLVTWMKHRAESRPTDIVSAFKRVVEEPSNGILKGALHLLELLAGKLHIRDTPYCYLGKDGELIHYRPFYQVLEMLLSLLNNPWWSRVWVLQEACLSKTTPVVHVGSEQFSMRSFIDGRRGWIESYGSWQDDDNALSNVYDLETFITRFGLMGAYSTSLETINHKFGRLNLSIGLDLVNRKSAGDKRDFVYGIMGVIAEDERIPIDYSLNLGQVFSLASWYVFTGTTHGFDVLKEAVGPSATSMPSWAVDWAQHDETYFGHSNLFATDEDTDPELTQFYFPHAGVLQVTGNKLDRIASVLETNAYLDFPTAEQALDIIASWVQQLKTTGTLPDLNFQADDNDDDDNALSSANFLTTVLREAIKDERGQMTRINFPLAASHDREWKGVLDWLKQSRVALDANTEAHKLQVTSYKLVNDLQRSIQRSALCVTGRGRLCMAVAAVKAGDYLYHVRGCCVPLALRATESIKLSWTEGEREDEDEDDKDESLVERMIDPFQVVGPCYLRGAMGIDRADREKEQVIFLV